MCAGALWAYSTLGHVVAVVVVWLNIFSRRTCPDWGIKQADLLFTI